jgi:hypothetical protein
MFLEAIELFPKHKDLWLKYANNAGQITWEKGLNKKGNGICHGISGNGYLLHSLYRKYY